MFLVTIAMIFYDIKKRYAEYEALIADNVAEMARLNMQGKQAEIADELAMRLAGTHKEDAGDDQLLGEASKLRPDEYQQHMQ